jgi:hypothetical protein
LKRTAILTFQYYRILFLYNVAFTILWIAFALYGFGELNAVVLFWAKISGFASAAALNYYMAKQSYFYFRNAGYRMRRMIITAFLADALSFIVIFLLFTVITHAAAHLIS